jgi:hypothetical protein
MGVDDGVDISPTKSKQRTLSYDCVAIAIGSWGKKDEKPKMLPFPKLYTPSTINI